MKDFIQHIFLSRVLAIALALLSADSLLAQDTDFPYPSVPDTLRKPEARADYLPLHYWDNFDFSYFKDYPSVQWKLLNLQHLKKQNPIKLTAEASKLQSVFG